MTLPPLGTVTYFGNDKYVVLAHEKAVGGVDVVVYSYRGKAYRASLAKWNRFFNNQHPDDGKPA